MAACEKRMKRKSCSLFFVRERGAGKKGQLGRSSGSRISLLAAPSRESPRSGVWTGFVKNRDAKASATPEKTVPVGSVRPRLQRRDRDGIAPSSLFFPRRQAAEHPGHVGRGEHPLRQPRTQPTRAAAGIQERVPSSVWGRALRFTKLGLDLFFGPLWIVAGLIGLGRRGCGKGRGGIGWLGAGDRRKGAPRAEFSRRSLTYMSVTQRSVPVRAARVRRQRIRTTHGRYKRLSDHHSTSVVAKPGLHRDQPGGGRRIRIDGRDTRRSSAVMGNRRMLVLIPNRQPDPTFLQSISRGRITPRARTENAKSQTESSPTIRESARCRAAGRAQPSIVGRAQPFTPASGAA